MLISSGKIRAIFRSRYKSYAENDRTRIYPSGYINKVESAKDLRVIGVKPRGGHIKSENHSKIYAGKALRRMDIEIDTQSYIVL